MRYLSLCSGIEAASVAFEPLGWEPVAFSEIDPFPSAVLKHRFPNVPNWGDMSKFEEWPDECRCNSTGLDEPAQSTRSPLAGTGTAGRCDVYADKGTSSRDRDNTCQTCGGLNAPIDLICGGTPCQSFSIAGLRKGLDDARGNLMLTFGHILGKYRPSWFIWENVPGVLSSNEGRDFASFLGLVTGQVIEPPTDGWRTGGAISGIGSAYGIAYRVLDAQFTRSPNHPRAVPQRRRRVFVVGHLGDWRRAAAVLLDSESVSRNPPPRRETGQRVAGTLKGGSGERGYPDPSDGNGGGLVEVKGSHWDGAAHPTLSQALGSSGGIAMSDQELFAQRGAGLVGTEWPADVSPTLNAHFGDKQGLEDQHALNGAGLFVPVAIQGTVIGPADHAGPQGSGANDDGAMFTLTKTDQHAVAIRTGHHGTNGHGFADEVAHGLDATGAGQAAALMLRQRECKPGGGKGPLVFEEHSGTLATANDQTLLTPQMAVRRLVPVETERLQGFEDDHTNVPYRGKETSPDGPRYKAIGNSFATNVVEWLGCRIEMVEEIKHEKLV